MCQKMGEQAGLDRYLTACLRELYAQVTRALQAPVGESSLVLPNKAARSGQVLGFDSNGDPAAVGLNGDAEVAFDAGDWTDSDRLFHGEWTDCGGKNAAGVTDAAANNRGEVRWIIEDGGAQTYYIYFDITQNGTKSANPQPKIAPASPSASFSTTPSASALLASASIGAIKRSLSPGGTAPAADFCGLPSTQV